jgi:nitric oxide dioxygenase
MSATDRIRQTWALAAANPTTAQVFYANLFRLDPTTKPLFVGDLEVQGRKLTQTLSFIVDHLEDMDVLVPAAQDLARRHVGYGTTEAQYASVGAALLMTLRQLLGPSFPPEAAAAWEEIYGVLSQVMTDAAYGKA